MIFGFIVSCSCIYPKSEGKEYINHKDGNPRNNNVENLEWCTIAENNLHACRTGLRKILIR